MPRQESVIFLKLFLKAHFYVDIKNRDPRKPTKGNRCQGNEHYEKNIVNVKEEEN